MGGPEGKNDDLSILLISPLEGDFFPTEVTSIESVIRLAAPVTARIRVFNQNNLGELEVDKISESHIIISGSDKSVHERIPYKEKIADVINMAREKGKRLLGICWGHQFIAERLGGEVFVAQEYPDIPLRPEFGVVPLKLTPQGMEDPIFNRLRAGGKEGEEEESIFDPVFYMTHMDHVKQPPYKCKRVQVLAQTDQYPNQVLRIDDHIITTQMHPELIKIQVMHFIDHARKELIRILGKDKFRNQFPDWEEGAKKSVMESFRAAELNGMQFMRNFYYGPEVLADQLVLDIFSETGSDEMTPEAYRRFVFVEGEGADGEAEEETDEEE
ncbi:hypothetical protein JW752_03385 [Candidatus Peregrinibacteria bacterium]|nr:hypothetical protein [Candidatus Peregrinibacteria bacterium]